MSLREKLDEFLDDIQDNERDVIAYMVLGERIKALKLEIARNIANAVASELAENQEAHDRWMKAARASSKEYKYFVSEHKEMEVIMGAENKVNLALSENGNHG